MSVVFAHDHRFIEHEGNFYSTGGISKSVLKRYKRIFNNVKVLSRQVSSSNLNENLTQSSLDNVEFIKVPDFKSIRNFYKYSNANNVVKETIYNSDFVIARIPSAIGRLAIKWAKVFDKPYLVEVVGCSWDAARAHGNIVGKIIAPYLYLKQKKDVRFSPYTIYITEKFLQNRYPTNGESKVIPNVMIPTITEKTLKRRLKKINETKSFRFGLIGSLDVDYKGHKLLLEAIANIKEELPEFSIEFLGAGNKNRWIPLIENLDLQNNVVFKGTLPGGSKVYEWLDSIDISIQPSSAEAQGRSIVEAMSRGCPIIATRVGGIVELISDDYLVEPTDYIELSNKILKLVNDKSDMINQARENFNKSRNFDAYLVEIDRNCFLNYFKNSNEDKNK